MCVVVANLNGQQEREEVMGGGGGRGGSGWGEHQPLPAYYCVFLCPLIVGPHRGQSSQEGQYPLSPPPPPPHPSPD